MEYYKGGEMIVLWENAYQSSPYSSKASTRFTLGMRSHPQFTQLHNRKTRISAKHVPALGSES